MTFHSQHRPIESYFLALERTGLLVETLREPKVPDYAVVSESGRRWQRLPLFLHLRARRPKLDSRTTAAHELGEAGNEPRRPLAHLM